MLSQMSGTLFKQLFTEAVQAMMDDDDFISVILEDDDTVTSTIFSALDLHSASSGSGKGHLWIVVLNDVSWMFWYALVSERD